MKEALGDKVDAVRLSKRLKSHPVCLASEGEVSLEMEKVLNAMPADNKVKARRVLEINENHPIFCHLVGAAGYGSGQAQGLFRAAVRSGAPHRGDGHRGSCGVSTRLCALMSGQ